MTNSDRAIYILSFLIIFTIISFATGAPFLEEEMVEGYPSGNLLIMAALISCGVVGRNLTWNYNRLRLLNNISIGFGMAWFPVGIWLSGNARLNFINDGQDSFAFDIITAAIIFICFGMLLFSIAYKLNVIIRRKLKSARQ